MSEFETAFGRFVMLGAEAIGYHDKRSALIINALTTQHDAAQLHTGIAQGMSFHVPDDIQVGKDQQFVLPHFANHCGCEVRILIGPQRRLRLRLFKIAKLNI
jgi:hypothetical protein